ncbi:dihydrofolate reductase family protein [Rhizobium beringeri]|uniref:dihydrofolate reductase family protein n=1 Tax=Rhizobium beringeri TaxID=3019934 RepID=UPI003B5C1F18
MAWISRKLPTTAYRQVLSRARGKKERELSEIADLVGFARSLIAQGLVDQFALFVAPVALGKGLPLFSAPMPLKLTSAKAFPGGAVAQIYRPCDPRTGLLFAFPS